MAIPIGVFNGMAQGMNYMTQLAYHQMQQHEQQKQQMAMIQYKNQLEGQRAQELQETINRNTRANLEFETKARQTQADELDIKHFEHEKTLQGMKAQADMDRTIYEKKHEKGPAPEKYTAANAVEMRASYLKGKGMIQAKYSDDKFIGPLKQQLRAQGLDEKPWHE